MRDRIGLEDLEFIESETLDEEPWDYSYDSLRKNEVGPERPFARDRDDAPEGDVGSPVEDTVGSAVDAGPGDFVPLDQAELDDLFWEIEPEQIDDVESDVSWEEFALLEDGTDEDDEDYEVVEHRLTREDRALQVAAEIAADAGWTRVEALLLAEVLAYHSVHGKTRGALRALTSEWDVTPAELRLLFDLRAAWRSGGFNRTYWASTAYEGWPNLSWQQALRITRELRFESADEVMLFVDDCFEDWASTPRLIDAYFNFSGYLDAVIQHMGTFGREEEHLMPPFVDYSWFGDEHEEFAPGSPEWCDLFGMGLLLNNGLGREKYP